MQPIPRVATLAVAALLLAACSSPPRPQLPPLESAMAPPRAPFETALAKELDKLRAPEPKPGESSDSSAEALRSAIQREQDLERELRAGYARDGALPQELVQQLHEARDSRYDALYRALVDNPSAPLPDGVAAIAGGAR